MGERTGFLTEQEVAAIQTLHKKAPYAMTGISLGMFSLARRTGGMTFQGYRYVYVAEHDECVREDVKSRVEKMRKKALKERRIGETEESAKRQGSLDL